MISDIKSVAGSWKLNCQFSDNPTSAKANGPNRHIPRIIEKNSFINFFKYNLKFEL